MRATFNDALLLPGAIATVLVAWFALIALGQSSYSAYSHHGALETSDHGRVWVMLALLATWTLMVVAMMLPANLPSLGRYHRITGALSRYSLRSTVLVLGYVTVWVVIGALLYLLDLLLHVTLASSPVLERYAWVVAPVIVATAGAYQATSSRQKRLSEADATGNTARQIARGAFRAGIHHGVCCALLSWPLMLLMFAVGHGSILVMLVLGTIMVAERTTDRGRRMSPSIGVALIAAALAMVIVQLMP